jgi:hypothetical protein
MGTMTYDGLVINIDDRVLAHLQIVIVNKLRKEEGFLMSWKESVQAGSGRGSVWLDSTIPVTFKFDGSKVPEINKVWLDQLAKSANSAKGLIVTSETGSLVAVGGGAPAKKSPESIVQPVAPDSESDATTHGMASSI